MSNYSATVHAGPSLPKRVAAGGDRDAASEEAPTQRKRIRMDADDEAAENADETAFVLIQNLTRPFTSTQVPEFRNFLVFFLYWFFAVSSNIF